MMMMMMMQMDDCFCFACKEGKGSCPSDAPRSSYDERQNITDFDGWRRLVRALPDEQEITVAPV